VAVARRWAQQQPTTERYKEIQQALFERGYFHGDPDGTWGPESIESLKRFQRDQSLTEDGKIGSLSLIALGLGPKRTAPEPAPEKTQNQ
jgi:peptidoglycan hydrolase-like protein with peptidoglycan-binding domain